MNNKNERDISYVPSLRRVSKRKPATRRVIPEKFRDSQLFQFQLFPAGANHHIRQISLARTCEILTCSHAGCVSGRGEPNALFARIGIASLSLGSGIRSGRRNGPISISTRPLSRVMNSTRLRIPETGGCRAILHIGYSEVYIIPGANSSRMPRGAT